MISAEVIADSISPVGIRITTLRLRYPKFIHGEFMTHRVFSRNASSSRAVPTKKLLEEVRADALRAAPVFWGKNQAGMSAVEELSRSEICTGFNEHAGWTPYERAQYIWRKAAIDAAKRAEELLEIGAHKQIVNRILEPFLHINVVVTATEWNNFFGLRLDKAAQPEMRALAEAIWNARKASKPMVIKPGEWHLPFVEVQRCYEGDVSYALGLRIPILDDRIGLETAIKVSVARCARVSYESFETGKRSTVEEDLALYDRLIGGSPIHASPAEHQATPDKFVTCGAFDDGSYANPTLHGNFRGWNQYRKTLPNESLAPLPKGYEE